MRVKQGPFGRLRPGTSGSCSSRLQERLFGSPKHTLFWLWACRPAGIMFHKIAAFFFRGLILVAPIAITVYVLVSAFQFLDALLPTRFPGLGLLVLLVSITLTGALSQTLLINPVLGYLEKGINKVPLAALIYSSLRDLLSAFVGDKRKFGQPVRVETVPGSGIFRLGFVTRTGLEEKTGEALVAVYFPHSYNISGELLLVPPDRIIPVENWKSADAMKFVVSGGVAFGGEKPEEGK